MRPILLAGLTILTFLCSSKIHAAAEWELSREEDGIKVYTKDIPGTGLVGFKGVKTMHLPIARLAELVLDKSNERKKRWIDMIMDFQILKSDPLGFTFYSSYDLPWPATDRDFIVDCRAEVNKERKEVAFILTSTEHPDAPATIGVRAKLIRSVYKLVALSPDTTEVTAEIQADPKGNLPKWLVNLIQRSWPTKTLKMMEEEAAAPDLPENELIKQLLDL